MRSEFAMEIRHKPKLELLFEENIPEFNRLVAEGTAPDLRNSNLSGLDLHTANLKGLDLSGAYLRGANLKGLDLTGCNLAGASIQNAMISGTLFPANVTVDEIRFSAEYGYADSHLRSGPAGWTGLPGSPRKYS